MMNEITNYKPIVYEYRISDSVTQSQIEKNLKSLNDGNPGAWDQLMNAIGGQKQLSTYRTPNQLYSLLDLCGKITDPKTKTLTRAAMTLLDNGFQYSVDGQNNFPPRYQWGWDPDTKEQANNGYCGEMSFITAALAYGEYISQYDARAIASGSQTKSQLLIGDGSDIRLAKALHLNHAQWDVPRGSTKDFIAWVTKEVMKGYPVLIGLYFKNTDFGVKDQGDDEYDHIVVVTGITEGKITFCDNGLYGGNTPESSQYIFTYPIDEIIKTRDEANRSPYPYSIPYFNHHKRYRNHGIAIKGVQDKNNETFPIRLLTHVNNELEEIKDGSNQRPVATWVTLTGCITGLTPGKNYNIYVYDDLSKIPDSDFNKNGDQATQRISFTANGISYVFTNEIQSSDTIAYRVVSSL